MWNLLDKLKRKIRGEGPPADAAPRVADREKNLIAAGVAAAKEAVKAGAEPGAPPLAELEKKGLLGKFFRHWKDPALLKQMKVVVARMQADGVNVKDMSAVQAWIKAHQKEIDSGRLGDGAEAPKPQTYVKTGPQAGRNDPCPCGSGRKYKKCCAAKSQ